MPALVSLDEPLQAGELVLKTDLTAAALADMGERTKCWSVGYNSCGEVPWTVRGVMER